MRCDCSVEKPTPINCLMVAVHQQIRYDSYPGPLWLFAPWCHERPCLTFCVLASLPWISAVVELHKAIDLLRVPLNQKFCPKKAFLKDKNLFVVCKLLIIIMRDEDS